MNPIDTGSAMSLTVLREIIEIAINETACNIIVLQEIFDRMADFFGREAFFSFCMNLLELGAKSKMPIVLVWPPEATTVQGTSLRLELIEKEMTIYPSLRRAARAISKVIQYGQC